MGFLDDSIAWLEATLATSDGVTVTYRRGSASVELTAVVGQTEFVQETGDDTVVASWKTRDYIVAAADLEIAGETLTPKAGDVIEETIGGTLFCNEVVSAGSETAARHTAPEETHWRIHTKRIG